MPQFTNDNRVSGLISAFGPDPRLLISWCLFPIRNNDERSLVLSLRMIYVREDVCLIVSNFHLEGL
jgi:hypothetical protein